MKNIDVKGDGNTSEKVIVLNAVSVSDSDGIGTSVGEMNVPVALLSKRESVCASDGTGPDSGTDGVGIAMDA